MGIRTGREFTAGLRDGRTVYASGKRVEQVTDYPPFRGALASLGELIANVELVSGLVRFGAQEVIAAKAELTPPRAISATLWVLIPQSQVRAIQLIRELSGSGLIMTPTENDFANPEIATYLEKYLRGKNLSARDRVQLFKLAWDLVGEPFGSRQLQYEWFYAGDPYFTRGRFYSLPVVQEYKEIVTRLLHRKA